MCVILARSETKKYFEWIIMKLRVMNIRKSHMWTAGWRIIWKMIIAVIDANFAVRLIPLWSSTGDEDSLYNEIAPSLSDNTPLLNDELSVPVRMRRKDYRPPPAITNLLKSNTRLLQFMVIRQGLWMRGLGPNQAVMAARNLRTLTTAARLRALHLR